MTHGTRCPIRHDRHCGRQRSDDPDDAREKRVADLSVAFLCADLGLSLERREDHAALSPAG